MSTREAGILHSPTKRPRLVVSPATRFIASPIPTTKEDAIRQKSEHSDHVQLRYISSGAIPESDVVKEPPEGYQVCVSPHRTGFNQYFQELTAREQRLDSMELFFNALFTSVPVCLADLTMVSIYVLDYHVRRLFLEKKEKAADPKAYQSVFVGKSKNKPFKGTNGVQIRYIFLLRAYQKVDSEEGKHVGVETMKLFEDLLTSAEQGWVASFQFCGYGEYTGDMSFVRRETMDFFEGEEKGNRDTGSHLFTQIFYQQWRTPLEKQHFKDPVLPPESDVIFNMKQPGAWRKIGLKMVALADLERRLSELPSSPHCVTTSASTLTKIGGQIVKFFVKTKTELTESVEFRYGTLKASLDVDSTSPTKVFDMLRTREDQALL